VKRECSPASEAPTCEGLSIVKLENSSHEDFTSAGDIIRGESSSQGPRMRSLTEFSIEADLPLSKRLTPVQKKKKPGRPARRSSLRKGKGSDKFGIGGDDDWVDEPDVCAFCDDGVENSERLLWYGSFALYVRVVCSGLFAFCLLTVEVCGMSKNVVSLPVLIFEYMFHGATVF
jgi:hypothetical protein